MVNPEPPKLLGYFREAALSTMGGSIPLEYLLLDGKARSQ